jgi:tetratricopeptide (TPR) repeat protein/DNA-binding SARP family transcriptional activator
VGYSGAEGRTVLAKAVTVLKLVRAAGTRVGHRRWALAGRRTDDLQTGPDLPGDAVRLAELSGTRLLAGRVRAELVAAGVRRSPWPASRHTPCGRGSSGVSAASARCGVSLDWPHVVEVSCSLCLVGSISSISAAGVGCASVEFRVLEQVKAFDDAGTAIVLEPKLQVLLAMLLINQGAPVARIKLKSWLWDDEFRAETTFDGYVTDLRRALVSAFGDRVTLQPDGVGYLRLTVADPMCVDYRRFRARVAAAKAADSDEKAVEELGAAIEEFRGEPLGVLSGSELRNIRTDLDRQHRDACHDLVGRMIGLGWHADALTELNRYRTRWAQDEELFELWATAMIATGQHRLAREEFTHFDTTYKATPPLHTRMSSLLARGRHDVREHVWSESASSAAVSLFEGQRELGALHLPSALLRAEYGVVPFQHRDDELAALIAWLREESPLSCLLITAEGGQGKTRLALEFCSMVGDQGWTAGMLRNDLPAELLARVGAEGGRQLIVIDYAEGRADQVISVVEALSARASAEPARVLLLSRSTGEWQEGLLEADDETAAAVLASMHELALPALVTDDDRLGEFARAATAFSTRLSRPPGLVPPPADLDDHRYRNALDIHAAALAAVLDEVEPAGRGLAWADPVQRVLRHEHVYWERTIDAYALTDAHRGRLDQVVVAGTLFGAADRGEAVRLLSALPTFEGQPQDLVERFLTWSRDLYQGEALLNGMRPDRLGEDHAAATIAKFPDLVTLLPTAAEAAQARQAITVLGRAAPRHSALVGAIENMVRSAPARLLPIGMEVAPTLTNPTGLTSALSTVVSISADRALLDAVVADLPPGSIALAEFAAVATGRALEVHRHSSPADAELAVLLSDHGTRLIAVNDLDAAVPVLLDAVRLHREMASERGEPMVKAAFADALIELSSALYGLGHYDDSLDGSREAVALLRELVELDEDQFADNLVLTSTELAKQLLAAGEREEALALLDETVAICHRLSEDDLSNLPELAAVLQQQGYALAEVGRERESAEAFERAVQIFRPLAQHLPDGFAEDLASLLSNYSGVMFALGDAAEGVKLADEALDTAEMLVQTYGERFEALLAHVHNNRALAVGRQGHHSDAVQELTAAQRIFRRLADRRPEFHLPDLAMALGNRAVHLRILGRLGEAVEDDTAAADIHRKLADPRPHEFLPQLADALIRLFMDYWVQDQWQRAHEAIAEAVVITTELMNTAPGESRPRHTTALYHLSQSFVPLGKNLRAAATAFESMRQARVLVREKPGAFDQLAAEIAQLMGVTRSGHGQHRKALHAHSEALSRFRQLAEEDSEKYLPSVAFVYAEMAKTQRFLGDRRGGPRQALRTSRKAEGIWRDLLAMGNEAAVGGLAGTLSEIAGILDRSGDAVSSLAALDEAIVLGRQAHAKSPRLHRLDLWRNLRHKALALPDESCDEAVRLLAEAHRLTGEVEEAGMRAEMLDDLRRDVGFFDRQAVVRVWPDCPLIGDGY